GLSSIDGMGAAKIAKVVSGRARAPEGGRPGPYTDLQDFLARSQVDAGALYALAKAGALDALVPTRKGLITVLEGIRSGDSTTCIHKDTEIQGLPCRFDWPSEPVPVRILRGQEAEGIRKPPPKRCTRACRQYTPPAKVDPALIGEYSPA